jgi:transcriptional regulator with XRE-family HTH domain
MNMTGESLKQIRRDLKMNQADFARLLGYESHEHISRLESGKLSVPKSVQVLAYLISTVPCAKAIAFKEAGFQA